MTESGGGLWEFQSDAYEGKMGTPGPGAARAASQDGPRHRQHRPVRFCHFMDICQLRDEGSAWDTLALSHGDRQHFILVYNKHSMHNMAD